MKQFKLMVTVIDEFDSKYYHKELKSIARKVNIDSKLLCDLFNLLWNHLERYNK